MKKLITVLFLLSGAVFAGEECKAEMRALADKHLSKKRLLQDSQIDAKRQVVDACRKKKTP